MKILTGFCLVLLSAVIILHQSIGKNTFDLNEFIPLGHTCCQVAKSVNSETGTTLSCKDDTLNPHHLYEAILNIPTDCSISDKSQTIIENLINHEASLGGTPEIYLHIIPNNIFSEIVPELQPQTKPFQSLLKNTVLLI